MDLLFRRSQSTNRFGRPRFDLHAILDFQGTEETNLIAKYNFAETVLIEVPQPFLLRQSIAIGLLAFFIATPLIAYNFWRIIGLGWMGVVCIAAIIAFAAAFIFYHQKRETIYVKDLLHGRNFHCSSVCELVRKEAYLIKINQYLRQVMESAKHWNGVDRFEIHPMTKEEAKAAIASGPLF